MKSLLFLLLILSLNSYGQTAEEYYYKGISKANLKDYTGAIADYTKAIALNPENPDAYNNRGNSKAKLQD